MMNAARIMWGVNRADAGPPGDRAYPAVDGPPVETTAVVAEQDRLRHPLADGEVMVRAVLGTNGMTAGLFPLPTMRRGEISSEPPAPGLCPVHGPAYGDTPAGAVTERAGSQESGPHRGVGVCPL